MTPRLLIRADTKTGKKWARIKRVSATSKRGCHQAVSV